MSEAAKTPQENIGFSKTYPHLCSHIACGIPMGVQGLNLKVALTHPAAREVTSFDSASCLILDSTRMERTAKLHLTQKRLTLGFAEVATITILSLRGIRRLLHSWCVCRIRFGHDKPVFSTSLSTIASSPWRKSRSVTLGSAATQGQAASPSDNRQRLHLRRP